MGKPTEPLSLVADYNMTPAEAIDYYAVETVGFTQLNWAAKRGLSGHQSVNQNVQQARKKLKDPRNIIDTVVVDPDDVIEAIRFNNQPREYTNQRSAVIRISPPFDTKSAASIHHSEEAIHHSEEGNYYPPDMDPQPIHINPDVFVDETMVDLPIRSDERARAKDELDDPTDEEIGEFVEMAYDIWEEHARAALVEKTDINDSKRSHGEEWIVGVKYE